MNVNESLGKAIAELRLLENEGYDSDLLRIWIDNFGPFPPIKLLEDLVRHFKDKRDTIERTDIPLILSEYGLSAATMDDGTEVSISLFYETKQASKELLAKWLTDNGYADIIKDTLAFQKGEVDEELASFLKSNGYAYTRDSNINGMSLKKTIKDHVEAGGELPPPDAVAVSIFETAVVRRPKGGF